MYRIRHGQDRRGHRHRRGAAARLRGGAASGSPSRAWRRRSCSSEHTLTLAIAAYGFIAIVLPVWMLLCPRDYLSSYLKIGTIALLDRRHHDREPRAQAAGHLSQFVDGGPIVPGQALPVRVHHHRLRRDQRLPRAGRQRHHAQDDRQGERRAHDRLRRDADGRPRRRGRADRRLLARARATTSRSTRRPTSSPLLGMQHRAPRPS